MKKTAPGVPVAPAVTLRPASARDADALAELLAQLGHPLKPAAVRANLARLRARGSGTFVAVAAGRVVGVVSALVTPVLHRSAPVGRLSVLVVHKEFTGNGLGAVLLGRAEKFLESRGCARIEVTSASHREGAHRFYGRHGYAPEGVRFARAAGVTRLHSPRRKPNGTAR